MSNIQLLDTVLDEFIPNYSFQSLYQLAKDITPYATGLRVNGFIVPSLSIVNGNSDLTTLVQGMEIQTPAQFRPDAWIRCAYQYGLNQDCTSLGQQLSHNTFYASTLFPLVSLPFSMNNVAILRWLPFNEYCYRSNFRTAFDFVRDMFRLVALGLPVKPMSLTTQFACTNIEDYLRNRLFQGKLDPLFSQQGSPISSFIGDDFGMEDLNDFQQRMDDLEQSAGANESGMDDETVQSMLTEQAQMMKNNFVLSNDTEILGALSKMVELEAPYRAYVSSASPSGQIKVGQPVYQKIIRGHSLKQRTKYSAPKTSANPFGSQVVDNAQQQREIIQPLQNSVLSFKPSSHAKSFSANAATSIVQQVAGAQALNH